MNAQMDRLYKALYEIKGITGHGKQKAIADLVGATSQVVKNWELRQISKDGLIKISKALSVSLEWLESGAGVMSLDSQLENEIKSYAMSQGWEAISQGKEGLKLLDMPHPPDFLLKKEDVKIFLELSRSAHVRKIWEQQEASHPDTFILASTLDEFSEKLKKITDTHVNIDKSRLIIKALETEAIAAHIKSLEVSQEWVSNNLKGFTDTNNLRITAASGDSMSPAFTESDPIIVDTGVTSMTSDAVYVFTADNETFIKRLQKIPGEGVRVLSENAKYESWTLKPDMEYQIIAKVIKVMPLNDIK